jgi:hypothetical protein
VESVSSTTLAHRCGNGPRSLESRICRNAAIALATASAARLGRWWPAPPTSCTRASGRACASRRAVSRGTRLSRGSVRTSTGARTDGRTAASASSSRSRARCSARKVRHSLLLSRLTWAQTCQLTCSSGAGGRPCRQVSQASRARAIHGVSRHADSAHSSPAPGAASSLSQAFTHPGPTLASRTTASTRCGARLAAARATPPP